VPDVEGFSLPDHMRDGRGAGISQKHGVLRFVAEGSGYFYVVTATDVIDDMGLIVPV
jgi:hypothetical protein